MSSLANCEKMDLYMKKPGKFLDPALRNLYVTLASDVIGYMALFDRESEYSLKSELRREFFVSFEPIWSKCAPAIFEAKVTSLRTKITEWTRAKEDWMRRSALQREIRALLANCQ